MMQKVIYNIRYVHNYNKTHLQKQNQTNNTQHRICEIHVSRYIFVFLFLFLVRSALDTWKRKHISKNERNKHKQNIEYMKYMYMYQDIFL